jgi:hypothetical protein
MNNHLLPTDQDWPEDKALIAELSRLNGQVAQYVLRHLDADAGRAAPVSIDDETALAEHMTVLAAALQARVDRRAASGEQPLMVEGEVVTSAVAR